MVTTHKSEPENRDAQLNARMNSWQMPGLPPGLVPRVTARLLEQRTRREVLFPWSPMKLAAATAAAAVVGILLGVAVPTADAVADTTDIIEQLW